MRRLRAALVPYASATTFVLFLNSCVSEAPSVLAPDAPLLAPVHRATSLDPGEIRTIYGPRTITRATGAPSPAAFTLAGYAPAATITIVNGDASGQHRVTSGAVTVDGLEVFHPSDFKNKTAILSAAVTLRNASSVSVEVAGGPGDQLTVTVEGSLATSATVPAGGGVLALLGDQLRVSVPAGASGAAATITAEPASAPSSEGVPGTTIDMGPSGTQFPVPITLAIAFDPAQLPPGARRGSLRMHWWNVDHWERLPGQQIDVARAIVSAQVSHFSEFSLLPDTVEFCPTDPQKEADLRTAITHVAPGGVVLVCNGTFAMSQVLVDKPVTLRSLNPGGATLADADTGDTYLSGTPLIAIDGVGSGVVRLVDLGFSLTGQGVLPSGTYDRVEIDSARFSAPAGRPTVAIRPNLSTVAGARVDVDHSEFSDLQLGVWPTSGTETNVRRSHFKRFTGGAVVYSSGNTATTQSYGVTAENLFQNCSPGGCVRILTMGAVTVEQNRFEALDQPVTLGAVTLQGVNPTLGPGLPATIQDNVFVSHATASAPNTAAGWQFQHAIYISEPSGRTHVVRRNRMADAYSGLFLSADVDVRDNVVTGGYYAFRQSANRVTNVERNDFVGQLNSFTATNLSGNYHCNWWGSASGPTAPPLSPPGSTYAPWATAPIAGTTSPCNPTAGFADVRVCAMPGGVGATFATAAQALSFVASGGTVRFCDGTHAVANVAVSKPVTITAEGPGVPTVDAGGNARALLVQSVASGTVTISGLRFTGGTTAQVTIGSNVANAAVSGNEFNPGQTQAYGVTPVGTKAGVTIGGTGIGQVSIDHNAFIGGDYGATVYVVPGAQVTLANNIFRQQIAFSLSLSGAISPGTLITVASNTFDQCGAFGCLALGQRTVVSNNAMTIAIARPVSFAVQVGTNSDVTFSDNTITGVGTTGGSRSSSATYPVRTAIAVAGAATVAMSRNNITNAYIGLSVGAGDANSAAAVTGVDNTIATTWTPFNSYLTGGVLASLTFNWSDLTDYVLGFGTLSSFAPGGINVRCNWWGSASGPTAMGSLPSPAYTPLAASPAAGGTHTGCTP